MVAQPRFRLPELFFPSSQFTGFLSSFQIEIGLVLCNLKIFGQDLLPILVIDKASFGYSLQPRTNRIFFLTGIILIFFHNPIFSVFFLAPPVIFLLTSQPILFKYFKIRKQNVRKPLQAWARYPIHLGQSGGIKQPCMRQVGLGIRQLQESKGT